MVLKICPQKQVDGFLLNILARRGSREFRIVDFSRPPHAKGMSSKLYQWNLQRFFEWNFVLLKSCKLKTVPFNLTALRFPRNSVKFARYFFNPLDSYFHTSPDTSLITPRFFCLIFKAPFGFSLSYPFFTRLHTPRIFPSSVWRIPEKKWNDLWLHLKSHNSKALTFNGFFYS